jgi:hypothetical protein
MGMRSSSVCQSCFWQNRASEFRPERKSKDEACEDDEAGAGEIAAPLRRHGASRDAPSEEEISNTKHRMMNDEAFCRTASLQAFRRLRSKRRRRSISQGQGSALTPNTAEQKHNPCKGFITPRTPRVSWTTPRHQHATQQKSAPAESAAVCVGKLQSKRLGFGASCNKPSRLHTLLTHRNLRHAGRRLRVRSDPAKFFGYFLPKKVTTRTNIALSLRHGVGRDAPDRCVGCALVLRNNCLTFTVQR